MIKILILLFITTNVNANSLNYLMKKALFHQKRAHYTKEKQSNNVVVSDGRLKYPDRGNNTILKFSDAKKILYKNIFGQDGKTIYCGCDYHDKNVDLQSCGLNVVHNEKRAKRLEWEHVVPAENFGRAFAEWRDKQGCSSSTSGRKCAESNPQFNAMEADLYNLFPVEGEVNGLRSNFEYMELRNNKYDFGRCSIKLDDKMFEPRNNEKGIVARATLYMDWAYEGIYKLSDSRRKLFEAWDRQYPITEYECKIAKLKKEYQHNENPFYKKCY